MSDLRKNAQRMIASYTYGAEVRTLTALEDMAVKYAQRTLLLEKAYRYMFASHRLNGRARRLNHEGNIKRAIAVGGGRNNLRRRAMALYDQAAKI
jgi:hypothetical protein